MEPNNPPARQNPPPSFSSPATDSEIYSVRWSPDDSLIAAGCSDGTVKVYSGLYGTLIRTMNSRLSPEVYPVTSVRWRPESGPSKTRNILLAITCEGGVVHWHASSGKAVHSFKLQENQALCSDYNSEGTLFAIGCKDRSIKIYDEATRDLSINLTGGSQQISGHDNRIMSVKWIDHNYILSGGWDNNIFIWDTRNSQVIRTFYGPRVYGDSLDVKGDMILAGSYNIEEQVQVWSMSEGRSVFTDSLKQGDKSCMVYSAQFSKVDNARAFAVGGMGSYQFHVYKTDEKRIVTSVNDIPKAVYGIDFAHGVERVAVGSGDGVVRVFRYGESSNEHDDG